jgi:hypothetical protein
MQKTYQEKLEINGKVRDETMSRVVILRKAASDDLWCCMVIS